MVASKGDCKVGAKGNIYAEKMEIELVARMAFWLDS
jgi:hypothetical protein